MFVKFHNVTGQAFYKWDPDGEFRDFYTTMTGKKTTKIEDLPNLAQDRQEVMIRHVLWMTTQGTSRKIEAIKLVRVITGWGLKKSKDWVECISL